MTGLFLKTDKIAIFFQRSAPVLPIVIFVVIHIRLSQYAFDDAYIHFRVARNLLELGTPYFNANEIVKVSTSSGWIIFLAMLLGLTRLLGIEHYFRALVSILNSFVTLGGMLIFTAVIEKLINGSLGSTRKFFLQASYVALVASSSVGLMETPLALLLVGVGINDILRSRSEGFFCLALGTYVRLELVILCIVVVLISLRRERVHVLSIFLFSTLGVLPLLLYDLNFFHTIVPHSITAKSTVYSITGLHTLTRAVLLSFPITFSEHQPLQFIAGLILLVSIFISIMVTLILSWNSNSSKWIAVFTIWSLVTFGSYVAGHTLLFDWYMPLFTVPMLLAITLCATKGVFPRNALSTELQSVLFVINLSMLIQFSYSAVFDQGQYILFESGARVKTYLSIGKILHTEYPGTTLLSSEIGGLGYMFRGKILDAAGLASPDALEFHPMEIPNERPRGDLGTIPPLYVERHMPDLIVSFDTFAQALLTSKIAEQYNMVLIPAYLPEDAIYSKTKTIWGNKYLRIYIRKDLPLSEKIIKLGIH